MAVLQTSLLLVFLFLIFQLQLASSKSKCFFVRNEKVTWDQAKNKCKQEGKMLATIGNLQEQKEIEKLLSPLISVRKSDSYWIGLSDIHRGEDSFQWEGRNKVFKPLNFTHWSSVEPRKMNCVTLLAFNGKWYSKECDSRYQYISKNGSEAVEVKLGGWNSKISHVAGNPCQGQKPRQDPGRNCLPRSQLH